MLALWLFLVLFILIINQSYECSVIATHCTSCDDLNTKRTLSTNACACTLGFLKNPKVQAHALVLNVLLVFKSSQLVQLVALTEHP